LLEICRLADVVIVDEHSIYNPRDYNDKLLLGVKGTLSEAELNWMRLRLEGGGSTRSVAASFLPSASRIRLGSEHFDFRMSADEEVAKAILLIFDRFRLDGSAYAVFATYIGMGSDCRREVHRTRVALGVARYCYVLSILHNPIYAGAMRTDVIKAA